MNPIKFAILIFIFSLSACSRTEDCSDFRTGSFFMFSAITRDTIIIDRNDTFQVDKNLRTGEYAESKVSWISPCVYKLNTVFYRNLPKDGVDSFFERTSTFYRIISRHKDYYVFNLKIDSTEKHLDYTDTIWRRKF